MSVGHSGMGMPLNENGHAKRALVAGITGQDGSYLTEVLLKRGYEGYGIIRCLSSFNVTGPSMLGAMVRRLGLSGEI